MALVLGQTSVLAGTNLSVISGNVLTSGSPNTVLFLGLNVLVLDLPPGASTVTYGGTSMTLVPGSTVQSLGGGRDPSSQVWQLANPTAGSNIAVVTLSGGNAHVVGAVFAEFTQANQTIVTGAVAIDSNNAGTTISQNLTTNSANSIVFQTVSGKSNSTGMVQDNSQNLIVDSELVGATDFLSWNVAYKLIATAGSNSFGVSSIASEDKCIALVELYAASTSAVSTFNFATSFFNIF